jgi:hypothetical protein
MPIDLSAVNWLYVAILSLLVFIAALLGSLISFRGAVRGRICVLDLLPARQSAVAAEFDAHQREVSRNGPALRLRVDLFNGPVMRKLYQPGEMGTR